MKTSQKRATIYFDPDLHRALRLKAAETDQSVSDLVNNAVKLSLAEDGKIWPPSRRGRTNPTCLLRKS